MAIKKLTKDGYGQIELNQVAWRRDGRIEAQCRLDATEFADDKKAENGMLFAVDNVTRTLKMATTALAANLPIAINYSSEHIYDERTPGLKHFALGLDDFLPRLGYPAVQDKITTNTIAYDDGEWADDDALATAMGNLTTTPLYAGINDAAEGYITVSATVPTVGPVFKVIEYTTMPDGQIAVKLQVTKVL